MPPPAPGRVGVASRPCALRAPTMDYRTPLHSIYAVTYTVNPVGCPLSRATRNKGTFGGWGHLTVGDPPRDHITTPNKHICVLVGTLWTLYVRLRGLCVLLSGSRNPQFRRTSRPRSEWGSIKGHRFQHMLGTPMDINGRRRCIQVCTN